MFHIYALVDPTTSLVRYVGRTTQDPSARHRQHCGGKEPATGEWVRSLPAPPIQVLLESGEERRVVVGAKGKKKLRKVTVSAATRAEAKWIKRFRRTVLNRHTRGVCAVVWDQLTNPEEKLAE